MFKMVKRGGLMSSVKMKEVRECDRPYEKLEKDGEKNLSDVELLAIILKNGIRGVSIIELSTYILNKFKGFRNIYNMSLEELKKIRGIGRVKAIQIKAMLEISKRISLEEKVKKIKIDSPESIADYYMEKMKDLEHEETKVVFLNTKYEILGDKTVSVGTINQSIIHPREVFKEAIRKNAHSIILVHNHPSGNPKPSESDEYITTKLEAVSRIIEIPLLDHIIVGEKDFYSFKEDEKI